MAEQQRTETNPRGDDVNLRSGPQIREYELIAERIRADGPRRVLDWGCGFGQVSDLLCRAGLDVTSFDYAPEEEGVRPMDLYPHLSIHLSRDPRRLPFADGSFDAVLSCGVLEHVLDPDASLEEIRRVLVGGGTFYVYKLPNRRSYLEAVARRTGRLYYHGAFENDRVYDMKSAQRLLNRHGFILQEARLANMLPLTLSSRLAARASRSIWSANRALSAIPGLNLVATNIEVIARSPALPSSRTVPNTVA